MNEIVEQKETNVIPLESKEGSSVFAPALKRTLIEQKVRFIFNNRLVTGLTLFNIGILTPLALFSYLCNLFGFFNLAIFNYVPWFLFIGLWAMPYLTWLYSTITIPIKNGYEEKWDWSKSKKGRMRSALFNLGALHILSWCAAAKYVIQYYAGYLTSIRLDERYSGILLQDNLDSFILILIVAPIIFSAIAIFIQIRDYMINKDLLQEHFMKWEAPYISRFGHQYEMDKCDIIVGYNINTKKPIVLKEDKRFLHEAVIGATGSGKTSTTILLRIATDLIKLATGHKMGIVLLEPKGDAVDDVLTLAKKLGIPDEKIKVIDPTKSWSVKYNPFAGERTTAATSFQGTLNALTVDQDDFFKGQQNEAASSYTLLAKIRYGPNTDIVHVQRMFSDSRYLADIAEQVRHMITTGRDKVDLTPFESAELDSFEQVVSYFENDVLDYKTFRDKEDIKPVLYPMGHKYAGRQVVENKKDKYITGAKKYLNDIVMNDLLKMLFVCNDGEDFFDVDEFLKEGGVVLVNTALAELDELSIMFGQFFIRQFQSAVFRRAKENKDEGVERIPIFFFTDEFPLYANEAFERFLTLARSYKVGAMIAMQSIAQLDKISVDYRKSVLGNTSSKTVFGRGPYEDNEYFSKDFGEMLIIEESSNESGSPITSDNQIWGYRLNAAKKLVPRFTDTFIKELPFKQMIVQVVDETNSLTVAQHAIGQFVHESPLVRRFMSIKENEIKSNKDDKVVAVDAAMSMLGESISYAIDKPFDIPNMSEQHSVLPPGAMNELEKLMTEKEQQLNIPDEQRVLSVVVNENKKDAGAISISAMLDETEPYEDELTLKELKVNSKHDNLVSFPKKQVITDTLLNEESTLPLVDEPFELPISDEAENSTLSTSQDNPKATNQEVETPVEMKSNNKQENSSEAKETIEPLELKETTIIPALEIDEFDLPMYVPGDEYQQQTIFGGTEPISPPKKKKKKESSPIRKKPVNTKPDSEQQTNKKNADDKITPASVAVIEKAEPEKPISIVEELKGENSQEDEVPANLEASIQEDSFPLTDEPLPPRNSNVEKDHPAIEAGQSQELKDIEKEQSPKVELQKVETKEPVPTLNGKEVLLSDDF